MIDWGRLFSQIPISSNCILLLLDRFHPEVIILHLISPISIGNSGRSLIGEVLGLSRQLHHSCTVLIRVTSPSNQKISQLLNHVLVQEANLILYLQHRQEPFS